MGREVRIFFKCNIHNALKSVLNEIFVKNNDISLISSNLFDLDSNSIESRIDYYLDISNSCLGLKFRGKKLDNLELKVRTGEYILDSDVQLNNLNIFGNIACEKWSKPIKGVKVKNGINADRKEILKELKKKFSNIDNNTQTLLSNDISENYDPNNDVFKVDKRRKSVVVKINNSCLHSSLLDQLSNHSNGGFVLEYATVKVSNTSDNETIYYSLCAESGNETTMTTFFLLLLEKIDAQLNQNNDNNNDNDQGNDIYFMGYPEFLMKSNCN
eukprot:TRINITY_DN69_c2_g1_i1.p1 TRINITY_DN69_c2_g1~~TRINITY_DN69_c2_g1_i1.p1  ORF type:complete len:271 (-),score=72.32 TRINITY_DN69_c2_g1_i1:187-999(-)